MPEGSFHTLYTKTLIQLQYVNSDDQDQSSNSQLFGHMCLLNILTARVHVRNFIFNFFGVSRLIITQSIISF